MRFQIQKLKSGGYLATGYGEFENIIVEAKTDFDKKFVRVGVTLH